MNWEPPDVLRLFPKVLSQLKEEKSFELQSQDIWRTATGNSGLCYKSAMFSV